MGVLLHYSATRGRALTAGERARLAALAERTWQALRDDLRGRLPDWHARAQVPPSLDRPELIAEGPRLYPEDSLEPGEILAGASKVSHSGCGEEPVIVQVEHLVAMLTLMRRALPDAVWRVRVDDHDLPWNARAQCYELD
ncbi:hypothetical protein [Streptomonospora nanhaiensis]|uniref:Uncharacterized protein n=1 Tax=Streptomonospora nanhaiensis TaxID=1323731 RepID=A0A853BL23_9ACTN|nr:hypothetical protein [Streptomonospora nanhaiensis]MBV2365879.1 hypothetical protein [Streptomonospora nanhaiensis]NYI95256.1 hypothetical protein [Streptomonospora nanhaiensis]